MMEEVGLNESCGVSMVPLIVGVAATCAVRQNGWKCFEVAYLAGDGHQFDTCGGVPGQLRNKLKSKMWEFLLRNSVTGGENKPLSVAESFGTP